MDAGHRNEIGSEGHADVAHRRGAAGEMCQTVAYYSVNALVWLAMWLFPNIGGLDCIELFFAGPLLCETPMGNSV